MSPSSAEPSALVIALVTEVVDSFEKLELVVALARPGGPPDLAELRAAAGFPEDDLVEAADGLIADGAVERTPDGLALAAGAWRPHCDALVALYRADRMKVVTLMATAAVTRMRSRTARAFTDAFVIRSKKDDGER